MHNVIIIGSGPAGLTAAIYIARANLSPLLIMGDIGGQLYTTTDVENFPGFPKGVLGPELIHLMEEQARRFGTEIVIDHVTEIDVEGPPFTVKTYTEEYRTRTLIICTGSAYRKLGVPGEKEYAARGVSYCATCDGAFFKGQTIAVVGGGDSAMEEATFLTRFARKVYVIHRRDRLRASAIMQDRAVKNPKIEFIWNTVVEEVLGDGKGMTGVQLKNVVTGGGSLLPLQGLFIAIGHVPNTELFRGKLEMDAQGYLVADRRQRTNVPGIFAAGDVQDHIFRQAITAAGTGCAAAMEAERFIAELEQRAYPGK